MTSKAPNDNEYFMRTLQSAQIKEDRYFHSLIHDDIDRIADVQSLVRQPLAFCQMYVTLCGRFVLSEGGTQIKNILLLSIKGHGIMVIVVAVILCDIVFV